MRLCAFVLALSLAAGVSSAAAKPKVVKHAVIKADKHPAPAKPLKHTTQQVAKPPKTLNHKVGKTYKNKVGKTYKNKA